MDIVKVNWSGGKDSTAAELLHLREGHHTKVVNYIPMFTKDIPLITKRHYDFIMNTRERFKSEGAEIYSADGITFWDYVHKVSTRGKSKGRVFGYPVPIKALCGFKRDGKAKACENIDVGRFDYIDLGIAIDEVDRHNQLQGNWRSILVEKKITEKMAFDICRRNNMLSPHYDDGKRDGCVLCAFAKRAERIQWFTDYPEAYDMVLDLQEFVKRERPNTFPLPNYKMFIDLQKPIQLSLFGDTEDKLLYVN